MRKSWISIILACALVVQTPFTAGATTADEAKQENETTQEQLNEATNSISALEDSKESAQAELDSFTSQLAELMSTMEILNTELDDKEVELATAKEDLAAAEDTKAEQYEAMKKRIRFMYENGDDTLLTALVESESISDLLNKAEYVDKIYEYDRNLLTEYQETLNQVTALTTQLENEKSELETMQSEYAQQQSEMETLVAKKEAEVGNVDSQIAEAKELATQYQEKIAANNEVIKAEEERQAAAAAAAAAASAAQNTASNVSSGTGSSSSSNSNSDTSSDSNSSSSDSGSSTSSGSAAGSEVVSYACQFIGNPYVWGGTSLTNGTDCSGFTQSVYAHFGIGIPRTSSEQRSAGREVSYADAQPGDLICYSGHVALYMGNGAIVHASSSTTGIITGTATYRQILSVRRIL